MRTTLDGLLNRRISLEQPAEGFRVAVDTVLLAAAVPAKSGEKVLELGCGVGGVMLALAYRVPDIRVTGVEIQPELARLCSANIERNGKQAFLKVIVGDATKLRLDGTEAFDHVMMNPPYHDEARHDVSPNATKRLANTEIDGDLKLWIASGARALKTGGNLTLIHRADRLDEIVGMLKAYFGQIVIKPLEPKAGDAPKRIIIRAEKGGAVAEMRLPPFTLHNPDGTYTSEADAILRDGGTMAF